MEENYEKSLLNFIRLCYTLIIKTKLGITENQRDA